MNTVEAIQEYIKADSLEYLTHDGMMAAVRIGAQPGGKTAGAGAGAGAGTGTDGGCGDGIGHCSACMTGAYPVEFDP
jgi:glutamine phosphoribosylpyrophosphate amidotransferase